MPSEVVFKTIQECKLELVSHTVMDPMLGWMGENDNGWYVYMDQLSANWLPVRAARASFRTSDKTGRDPAADLKLMKHLADEGHYGVFEHLTATFLIECPLFIRSQIHRHRTFSYNEWSRRYTSQGISFWIPDTFRKQSKSNKQASTDEVVEGEHLHGFTTATKELEWKKMHTLQHDYYLELLDMGVAREQARAVLPQSLLTQFYMTGNLRNFAHFIKLRKDDHAQYEVRVIANRIEEELRRLWPEAVDALLGGNVE